MIIVADVRRFAHVNGVLGTHNGAAVVVDHYANELMRDTSQNRPFDRDELVRRMRAGSF